MTTPAHSANERIAPLRALFTRVSALIRGRLVRRQTRASLETTIAILKAQQEASLDGILVVDRQERILAHNQRFFEIWHIPPDVASLGSDQELLKPALRLIADPDSFLRRVRYLYDHPEEISEGDPIELKDGRTLSRTSVPVIAADGSIQGRAWYFRDMTEARRGALLQSALFRISETTRAAKDLKELYSSLHRIVGELMDATNFYIALYNEATDELTLPYFVDEIDQAPDLARPGRGLTSYVLRTGKALLATPEVFEQLVAAGEVESLGAPSVDWIGVPLISEGKTFGVIGVQSYTDRVRFSEKERDILLFVSQHIASVIDDKRKEADLRDSEHRYRQMFESVSAVKLLVDPVSGAVMDVNQAAATYYGYPRARMRGMPMSTISTTPPDLLREWLSLSASTERTKFPARHRHADGSLHDVEIHTGPVDFREGRFIYCIVQDVTETKQAEEALRRSEKHFRSLIEGASDLISILEPDGTIVYNSPAVERVLGYRVPATIGGNALEFFHPEDAPNARAQLHSVINGDTSAGPLEVRMRHRDGSWRTLEVVLRRLEDERYGTAVVANGRDVTERKRAEVALHRSEEKYRNIFDFASVAIYQAALDGTILTANGTMARMLGYASLNELLTRNMARDVYLEPRDRQNLIERYATGAAPITMEVQWKKKDGTLLWVQINAHAVRGDAGELQYFEGFAADVTERKRAELNADAANAQRKAVLDAAVHVSIIATDRSGTITVFNSGSERLLGHEAAGVIGRMNIAELHADGPLSPAGDSRERRMLDELADGSERESAYVRNDGTVRTVSLSITPLPSAGGVSGFLHVANDITERKRAEARLRLQSGAIEASMDGIAILGATGRFSYVNDAFLRLYGFDDREQILGQRWTVTHDHSEWRHLFREAMPAFRESGQWRGESAGRRKDGSSFPQEVSVTRIADEAVVAVVRDITERTYAEEQIKHLAYHDALTGLPNRLLFKDRLTVALSQANRDRRRIAILFLDLDRFKNINDSLGHSAGDFLLQSVTTRLLGALRDSDTVARLGGDEFIVLLPSLHVAEDAVRIAQKILTLMRSPFVIAGQPLYVTTSIGISVSPEDGLDAETLIKNADTAMYQAKDRGRDTFQLFNEGIKERALERLAIENGLRRALTNDELVVHYQPIFDLTSGRVYGMEALVRWQHPDLGLILPAHFIALAESTGLMVPIGLHVLRTACIATRALHDRGFRQLSVAVNLSACQLQQTELVRNVRQILKESALEPKYLDLEITESSAMQNPELSIATLEALKRLGVRISLDDFGIGHSSLGYLKRFPIDTLKIDQSFIRDIATDPDTAAIVTAIIAMGQKLRLGIVAEGVEHESQRTFLREHHCDRMQGFLLRGPLAVDAFERFLAEHDARTGQWASVEA